MQTIEYTLEELREMAELTDRIAANLKAIDENTGIDDLNELEKQTAAIAANLKYIDDHK